MKLRVLAHICLNFSFALLYQTSYFLCHIHTYICALVCVRVGGVYLILCVYVVISGILHLDSTTSEPLETLQPSCFEPPVTLPSQYPMKTLEGPQTLSEHPLVKGKCTCLVHVTHLLAP